MTKLPNIILCIINKNTPELRAFLESVGYTYAGKGSERRSSLYCAHGNYYTTDNKPTRGEFIVDCHGNEVMFKLVSTLKIDKPNEPLDTLTKAELLSIKKGIEDIRNRKTYKIEVGEGLTEFLNRIKKI